jgi:hypothetical protein
MNLRRLALPGLLCCGMWAVQLNAQPPANLLTNSGANEDLLGWQVAGAATTATLADLGGNRVFVLRGGASLVQVVPLMPEAAGQYLVYLAYARGDRVDRPADITDQPYLYGLTVSADGARILSCHQGLTMNSSTLTPGQWGRLWGIFRVPTGAALVTFEMRQGRRRGTPQDGSAARFDDVGLFLFRSDEEAQAFVDAQAKTVD